MILIVFLIMCCISIKTLLILINYQKGHTILIKKNSMIKSIFSIDLSLNWLYICFILYNGN